MFSKREGCRTVPSMQSDNNTGQEKCLKSFCLPETNSRRENVRSRTEGEAEINDS